MLSIKADEAISTCNKKEFKGQLLNIRHYGAPEQPRQDPKELRENLMQNYHQVMVRGINKKVCQIASTNHSSYPSNKPKHN